MPSSFAPTARRWLQRGQREGQDSKRSPGNLYGKPVTVHYDPTSPPTLVAGRMAAARQAALVRPA
ncbi:MAG TPA: hypothetical protein VGU65_02520 [Frateuria sp.]|uniref:hypothetical protein n=1 Tax=Frateuria sp. TaxID=2211372 RepID=UPI002DF602EE|nr:hypothetical protein [Frateuria sp.]